MDGQGDRSLSSMVGGAAAGGGGGGGRDVDTVGRNKEDENESRSGSDNLEGGSGDDIDQENPRKKKRYHRHTPQQIQELEAYEIHFHGSIMFLYLRFWIVERN